MELFRTMNMMPVTVVIISILICMMIPRTQNRMMNGYSYLPPSENGNGNGKGNGNGNGNGGPPIGIIKLDGKLNKDGSYMVSFLFALWFLWFYYGL